MAVDIAVFQALPTGDTAYDGPVAHGFNGMQVVSSAVPWERVHGPELNLLFAPLHGLLVDNKPEHRSTAVQFVTKVLTHPLVASYIGCDGRQSAQVKYARVLTRLLGLHTGKWSSLSVVQQQRVRVLMDAEPVGLGNLTLRVGLRVLPRSDDQGWNLTRRPFMRHAYVICEEYTRSKSPLLFVQSPRLEVPDAVVGVRISSHAIDRMSRLHTPGGDKMKQVHSNTVQRYLAMCKHQHINLPAMDALEQLDGLATALSALRRRQLTCDADPADLRKRARAFVLHFDDKDEVRLRQVCKLVLHMLFPDYSLTEMLAGFRRNNKRQLEKTTLDRPSARAMLREFFNLVPSLVYSLDTDYDRVHTMASRKRDSASARANIATPPDHGEEAGVAAGNV
jgi:hypothetical protein